MVAAGIQKLCFSFCPYFQFDYLCRLNNQEKMRLYRIIVLAFAVVLASQHAQAEVTFGGNSKAVYSETPESSTGLDCVYVLYSADGVSMSYTATTSSTVTWYSFGSSGGGYAQEMSGIETSGNVSTLSQVVADCGYIIEEGTDRTYLWVADYSECYLSLVDITIDSELDCGTVTLYVSGEGDDIVYYTINGAKKVIDRELTLEYSNLEWNDESLEWEQVTVETTYESFESTISLDAPYCNTTFRLSGDKLLNYWGTQDIVESETYYTSAIGVETTASQEERENLNEVSDSDSDLGGSAPVVITFTAYCTDAVNHKEWQISEDSEFEDLLYRYNDDEITHTFNDAGTFYVKLVATDASGECSSEGETYEVTVGESSLLCPNVFSPTSSEGVNDEWRVSYKSIVEFNCWIFNKWGVQICQLTDPSQGWDGKYKGKYVKSGTYYYVIKARGSDGIKYDLSGDINIIGIKESSTSSSSTSE